MEQECRIQIKDRDINLTSDMRTLDNDDINELLNATYEIQNASRRYAMQLLLIKAKRYLPTGMKEWMESDNTIYKCPSCDAELKKNDKMIHYCSYCGQHLEDGRWNGREASNG